MIFGDLIDDLKLLDEEEITLLVFGILSLLFTCSFIFSYIKVFRHTLHHSEIPTITISFCYLNNLVWYYYSDLRYHDYMKYCFEASIAVCIIMIFIFLYFQYKEDKIDSILNFFIILTSSWAIKKLIVDILDDEDKAKITAGFSIVVLLCSIIGWIISAFNEKNKNILNILSLDYLKEIKIVIKDNNECILVYDDRNDVHIQVHSDTSISEREDIHSQTEFKIDLNN